MKKRAFVGFLIVVGLYKPVFADENDFRCLTSVGLQKPVRLQFTFQTGKDDQDFVTYQRGSGRIKLQKIQERELRKGPDGRPGTFEMSWKEILPDGSGGRYVMVTQGARIYDFKYIRKDGKVLTFTEDSDASTEQGCVWK